MYSLATAYSVYVQATQHGERKKTKVNERVNNDGMCNLNFCCLHPAAKHRILNEIYVLAFYIRTGYNTILCIRDARQPSSLPFSEVRVHLYWRRALMLSKYIHKKSYNIEFTAAHTVQMQIGGNGNRSGSGGEGCIALNTAPINQSAINCINRGFSTK